MIAFDLMECRSIINRIQSDSEFTKPNDGQLEHAITKIAQTAQHKLPHILLDIGQSSSGADFQSSTNKKPSSKLVKTLILPTKLMSNSFLAMDLELTLKGGIVAGAYWDEVISVTDANLYAEQFVNHFMTGQGQEWHDDGGLSDIMRNTPEGQQLITQISNDFRAQMTLHNYDFSKIQLDNARYRTLSFGWKSSPTLKILVGGTQQLIVTLGGIFYNTKNENYCALISVEIRDDFGVTESDITQASPSAKLGIGGLLDMWVLQHQRGQRPFTTVFNFSFLCYDCLH